MTRPVPTVLIVDNKGVVRDFCSLALAEVGYKAEVAEDGDIALEKAEELTPDLVLLDLNMPGVSGMEVLKKI